jgi:hypothetical protein
MPSISQILAVSYPAVINENKKAANQFAESALLRELKRAGAIKTVSFGTVLEHTLDYKRNPGTDFLATDLTGVSLAKVEVLTAAQYDPGQLSVPIVWSKADEAKNPSENQKIALVQSLLDNALESHDDAIEEALFTTSTDGFLGLLTHVPDSGQGTDGGIDASTDTWWRNYSSTYLAAGTNMQAQLTKAWNAASKGSGGSSPRILVSGADAQGIYEGTLQANQRYVDTDEGKAGFKTIAFKNARYVFSQYGGTRVHLLNPKAFMINISKDANKEMGSQIEIQNQNGYVRKLYTMLQSTTGNKSRNAVLTQN